MKRNIFANFIGKFWSILSNFLFVPLYIKYLGFESYSIISFTLIIAGVLAVLDGGLTATLSREFARTDNSDSEKFRIFKTLETIYLILIGLIIIVFLLLSNFIANNWLNLRTFEPYKISLFIKIISFDIGFQLLFRFYLGGLLGLEKQIHANFFQICWGILRNGLVVIVIMLNHSLELFFYWQTFSTVISTVLLKIYFEKTLTGRPFFKIGLRVEKEIIKKVWKFAVGMMLISLISALNTQLDKIAISKLLSIENLGYYTLAVSLAQVLVVLTNPIATTLLPRFTAYFSSKQLNRVIELFRKIGVATSIFIFSFTAVLFFFSKELIWIWTGDMKLAQRSFMYLPVIAISMSMLSIVSIPYTISIANGYTKLNNLLGVVSLFVTLPGYWIATKYYGAIGAAFVFCFVQTLTTFVYLYFINKKFLKLKIVKEIYLQQIIIPLLLAFFIVFVLSKIPNIFTGNRILSLLWISLISIFTLIISSFILFPFRDIKRLLAVKKITL